MKNKSTFRSKWFKGLITIININEEDNDLEVSINPQEENRSVWTEHWNLTHTRFGLTNGEYYDLTL